MTDVHVRVFAAKLVLSFTCCVTEKILSMSKFLFQRFFEIEWFRGSEAPGVKGLSMANGTSLLNENIYDRVYSRPTAIRNYLVGIELNVSAIRKTNRY